MLSQKQVTETVASQLTRISYNQGKAFRISCKKKTTTTSLNFYEFIQSQRYLDTEAGYKVNTCSNQHCKQYIKCT